MTELDRTWAKTQIEAMADGSLSAEAARRMRTLMNCDPGIRAEVERARALRLDLKALAGVPVPKGLRRKLWRIPAAERPRRSYWMPAAALASVAAVALGVGLFLEARGPSEEELAREAALQDFAIAMEYLQRSALMARNEVNEAVGSGVMDALAMSRGAIRQSAAGIDEGEQDNDD